jgi:hypothetical protein
MKKLILFLFVVGCAHGKIGAIEQGLQKGSIDPANTIYVPTISTANTAFSGDKSAKQEKVDEEKKQIEQRFNRDIAEQLRKKGFKAEAVSVLPKTGLVLIGSVTRFEHGSAAARIFVGMGAGSSNMFTDFQLKDVATEKTLAKFEIIATSGGNGGLQAAGGYIKAHLIDGSEKTAEYIAKANSGQKVK